MSLPQASQPRDNELLDAGLKIRNALSLLGKGNHSVREMRSLIMGLESVMFSMAGHLTAEEFKTTHHFSPGVYTRELFIPKGTTLTGRIHKTEHLNILSQGVITVWTEGGMKTLTASTVIPSKPCMKRVGYAHEDSIWITVHQNPTNETDISKVEKRLFADTFEEVYLDSNRTFEDALYYFGMTQTEMQSLVETIDEPVPFPETPEAIRISESPVHGKGVFAVRNISAGEVLAPARIDSKRTPAGRYCNHSGKPNVEMKTLPNGDMDLVAIQAIDAGSELFNDYFLTAMSNQIQGDKICLV